MTPSVEIGVCFVSVNGPKRLESAFAVTELTSHNSRTVQAVSQGQ